MKILVTGGLGYIGSHTVIKLIQSGFEVVILDNLANSSKKVLERIQGITNKEITFYEGSVGDDSFLNQVFAEHDISSVIHFAALKSVSESNNFPLEYYDCNVSATLTLLKLMQQNEVYNFIFSSSATVYGGGNVKLPITESCPIGNTTNPYGTSKYFIELILRDLCSVRDNLNVKVLRYFNPVGAHISGMLGESPVGTPNNLVPYVADVAIGNLDFIKVFGNDYPTPDGTGMRDYIHVEDLADGHVKAIQRLYKKHGLEHFNLGTGRAYSVLEIIDSFKRISGKDIKYQITERRSGDIAECWADTEKAEKILEWKASKTLDDMISDTWRWKIQNPNGYN